MIIVEENGYSFMLTSVTQKDIDVFLKYIEDKTPYSGIIGLLNFKVPKNNKKVDVFIIDCVNSRDGRREILDYWMKKGQIYDQDNINLLNI